jgi:hypothetical protein
MAEPAEVVEAIQADAVASAIPGQAAIAGEVAVVADQLADHAEVSEERHEEIIEGEVWLRDTLRLLSGQTENLSGSMVNLQTQSSSNQAALVAMLQAIQTTLENRLPASQPLIPVTPNPEETLVVVEPTATSETAGEDLPESKTDKAKKRKRRII